MVLIYYSHYDNTINIIMDGYRAKHDLIEQSIYNETKYTQIISRMAEVDFSDKMKHNSNSIIDKYLETNSILNWDLKKMKEKMNDMDIYILNSSLQVIDSTIEEEIGLTFEDYPEFAKILKERQMGNKFETDSINFSIINKELKKYSYMPTPDNKYLIELSANIGEFYPDIKNLNITYLSNILKDKYSFVEDINILRFSKSKGSSYILDTSMNTPSKDINPKENQNKYTKKVLETNKVQEQILKDDKDNKYIIKYIPYTPYNEESNMNWWQSYVIEIIYNDKSMIYEIDYQRRLFIKSMGIITILYFAFSFIIISLVEKNRKIAYKDYLTKLPNRKRFEEVLEYKILEADKKHNKIAILFFDLDKFKDVNDTFGHNFGDKVLQEVGRKIKDQLRKEDMVSRLGGDEFTVLITDLNSLEEIELIGRRMGELFKDGVNIDGKEIFIKPSIGISIYPDHGKTIEELIQKADKAMYSAKENKSGYKISEEEVVVSGI